MQNRRGFTLIEMLVVVLIIAVIVGIALPNYMLTVRRAQTSKVLPALRTVASSLMRYGLENGALPQTANHSGQALREELNKVLDIGIPEVSGFKLYYYSDSYLGYKMSNDAIWINVEWRTESLKNNKNYAITCAMEAAAVTDDKKKLCSLVCNHDNFFSYDDAYGCAVNNSRFGL